MKITGSERETLSVIASCPFVDRLELAAISGASRSAVYEAVRGLEDGGLVAHVPHAADLIPPTRRYRLTARGLGALAEDRGLHRRIKTLIGERGRLSTIRCAPAPSPSSGCAS